MTGRWPEKSVKFLLRLLKNAESNADAKNLDLEDLFVKNIVVQQAPVCLPNTVVLYRFIFKKFRKPAVVLTAPMVVSTPIKVILAI